MGRKMKKSLAIILALAGILLLATIWIQSKEVERGIIDAIMPVYETATIDSIKISRGDKHITLKKSNNIWMLQTVKGLEKPADSAKVLRLLNELSATKFGELASDSLARHEVYEISDNQGITVALFSQEAEQFKLIFGKRGKDGTVFIRLPGHSEVFRGINAPLNELALDELSWREKHIFSYNSDEITKILATVDGTSYTLAKDGSSFVLMASDLDENYRLDQQRAEALFRSLSFLKASDFDDESSSNIGVVTASFAISFGAKTKQLFIGSENENGKYKALLEGQNAIYILAASTVDQIKKSPTLLRDLALFAVDINSIKAVRFGDEGKTELRRDETGNFVLADGSSDSDFDLKSAIIAVRALSSLRASRYLGGSGTLGLSKKARLMEIEDQNGLHRVTIGDRGADNLYIAISSDFPGTYGVDAHNLMRFDGGKAMFKRPPTEPALFPSYEDLQKLPPEVREQILKQIISAGK